jgi:HEAT repeat protein
MNIWLSFSLFLSFQALAAMNSSEISGEVVNEEKIEATLLNSFKNPSHGKADIDKLKTQVLVYKNRSVPALIKVMKDGAYPEQNRWLATFMLGRIMGEKSAPFISKFVAHPHWMMRLAALKTLLLLKQKNYQRHYAQALKDQSLLVRYQALENVEKLKIKELGPSVWKMLYNKENYSGKDGKLKRASIMKNVIRTIGEIEFKEAQKPMQVMLKSKKFSDLHDDLKYSLAKLK